MSTEKKEEDELDREYEVAKAKGDEEGIYQSTIGYRMNRMYRSLSSHIH
jgi:hypothetical protein